MIREIDRPSWWRLLRNLMFFVVNGSLAILACTMVTHQPVSVLPWGGLLFGALVFATLSTLFPRRRRR
ncbi:hypothetical protein [Kitasatospora sp. GP30]|uniref:hypothetical protein n=1 Tax=Kitasatospora sp. GP30 TaxID=3035084 RepID=UPI0015D5D306|nr:hypothetical protein [Kitasatospora sp. GP30]